MQHIEAERYAEAVLFVAGAIERGLEAARQDAIAKRRGSFGPRVKGGKMSDPTADEVLKKTEEITVLRCMDEGRTFQINYPERWLEVFEEAYRLFRNRYGDDAYEMIRLRYQEKMSTFDLAEQVNLTRRRFNDRRKDFLSLVLILAAQKGILKIDG